MNSAYNFTPINLEGDTNVFQYQQQINPCYNYNLLQGSLASNDIKIESLDEALLDNTSTVPSTQITSKKRKTDQDDVSFVRLTREQLLEMSSNQFEERVKLLQTMRPLTLPEDEEIKRQRKLIKNREYAQTSRIKKRETLSSLQVQLTAVNTENQILKSHINNLSQQVQYLQVENHQLRMMFSSYSLAPPTISPETIITQQLCPQNNPPSIPSSPETYSDAASPSLSLDENDPLGVLPSDSDETTIDFTNDGNFLPTDPYSYLPDKITWDLSDNYTTSGLCLLVILFSFGLFFNGVIFQGLSGMIGPSLPPTSTSRTLFNHHTPELTDIEQNVIVVEGMERLDMGKEKIESFNVTTDGMEEKSLREKRSVLEEQNMMPYL